MDHIKEYLAFAYLRCLVLSLELCLAGDMERAARTTDSVAKCLDVVPASSLIDACRKDFKKIDEGDACLAYCESVKTCQELSLLPRELPSDLTPYLVQPSTRVAIDV